MNIGYKPGDKIPLEILEKLDTGASQRARIKKDRKKGIEKDPRERNKTYHESVKDRAMREYEKEKFGNIEYLQSYFEAMGTPRNFIDESGAINSDIYHKSKGGIFVDFFVDQDINATRENNKTFQKDSRRDGYFAEVTIPIILNKLLRGSDFIIVGASEIDDNNNGVDNVIFNTRTGQVICALDELVINDELIKMDASKMERFDHKMERFVHSKKNGAQLKYGAIFKDNKFQKLAHLTKLPIGVLRVERDLFYKAMKDMDFSIQGEISHAEISLVNYMNDSLNNQIESLMGKMNVSYIGVRDFVDFLSDRTIKYSKVA